MQHSDFNIGSEFNLSGHLWRCTDVGQRTVVAIKLNAPDDSWYSGPPYAVAETVIDEHDIEACTPAD